MLPFVLALQLGGGAPPPPELPAASGVARPVQAPSPAPRRALPSGFGRLQIGLGPPAFSPETSLLRLEGYGGSKLWIEIDGGHMSSLFGRHVGGALWGAVGHWYSPGSSSAPPLHETDYLAGVEIPVRFGTSTIALLAAPRVGVVLGSLSLGGEARSQSAFAWGAQVSAVSSRYHLCSSVSFLSAVVDPPGDLGRSHNLGGLYFSVGALLDDG
jgi:hypothetical protein